MSDKSFSIGASIATLIVSVAASVFATCIDRPAKISYDTSVEFLDNYYSAMMNSEIRKSSYASLTTATYQRFNDYEAEVGPFYETLDKAVVKDVLSTQTTQNEPVATLVFSRKNSEKESEDKVTFFLVCEDYLSKFPFRTCPTDKVKIENTEWFAPEGR